MLLLLLFLYPSFSLSSFTLGGLRSMSWTQGRTYPSPVLQALPVVAQRATVMWHSRCLSSFIHVYQLALELSATSGDSSSEPSVVSQGRIFVCSAIPGHKMWLFGSYYCGCPRHFVRDTLLDKPLKILLHHRSKAEDRQRR